MTDNTYGFNQIEVGDRITFRAPTRWHSGRAVTRKVNGFYLDKPTVRFGGWSRFVVRREEIVRVQEEK